MEIVKALLANGADKDVKDTDGKTPLHIATAKGHLEIVKALLDAGADKDVEDNMHKKPINYATDPQIKDRLK